MYDIDILTQVYVCYVCILGMYLPKLRLLASARKLNLRMPPLHGKQTWDTAGIIYVVDSAEVAKLVHDLTTFLTDVVNGSEVEGREGAVWDVQVTRMETDKASVSLFHALG
jgi:hypothetical protein